MNRLTTLVISIIFLSAPISKNALGASGSEYWPSWRGQNCTGISKKGNPPVTWSETKNIKWKVKIPGHGLATPISVGDLLILQTAVKKKGLISSSLIWKNTNQKKLNFTVIALGRHTGKIRWQRVVRRAVPHEGIHGTASWASNSPVTDGKRIYAFFGSNGLYCLDLED